MRNPPTIRDLRNYVAETSAPIAKGVTNGDSHDHIGGDGAQIDHGGLAGLADDDHTQYLQKSGGTITGDIIVSDTKGLDFSAYSTGSSDKNVLDDYHEDIWTPGLLSAGSTPGTTGTGYYTKIGRMVFFSGRVTVTSLSGVSGAIRLSGLPFTANSETDGHGIINFSNASNLTIAQYASLTGRVTLGTTNGDLYIWESTAGTNTLQVGDITATTILRFNGSYFV